MKVAVITPYCREPDMKLLRCMRSVAAQTHACTHFMVADGSPRECVAAAAGVRHVVLPQAHGDNGNTPRGIGAISALNAGFEAFAFLDADNWLAPDHVASLVEAVRTSGAAVAFSGRRIVLPDGTPVEWPDPGDERRSYADTSTFFVTAKAAFLLPFWAMMDQPTSPCCDRVMFGLVRGLGVTHVFTDRPTLFFESHYSFHHHQAGREPPPDAHDIDFEAVVERQSAARSLERTRMDLTIKYDAARRRRLTPGFVETGEPTGADARPDAGGGDQPTPVQPTFDEWATGVFLRLREAPDRPPPRRKILILSTPRSGASVFGRVLAAMTGMGIAGEWLDDRMIRAYARVMNRGGVAIADYWRFIQAKATSAEGGLAIEAHVHDVVRMLGLGVDPFAWGFDGVYFVERRDKFAQAMSLAKARAGGRWHGSHRALRVVQADDVSFDEILQALREIAAQEERHRSAFAPRVRRSFVYEEVCARPEVVGGVCADLGLAVKDVPSMASDDGIQRTAADARRVEALRRALGLG